MQVLLKDIELDVQELKCLIQSMSTDTNPVLKIVAKRSIYQMKERLDALTALLDATFVITPAKQSASTVVKTDLEHKAVADLTKEVPAETVFMQDDEVPAPQILAERIKPARMNEIVGQLGKASSLEEAMSVFMSKVQPDEENEAAIDFVELLKKYFS